ncbi:MAG TPA: RNA polymerase sigma factor [Blastocatellia bacterium]|nr:RNA polymerase sigma factor [Blastocatellia bacterium]
MSEVAEIALMTDSRWVEESAAGGIDASLLRLIERVKAGDAGAFEQIMIRHQERVFATAWRMLGNREDARDAAQEVFLRVYKYLKNYDQKQDFSGWLYRIVINVCRDTARKRGKSNLFTSFEDEREQGALEAMAGPGDIEAAAILAQEQKIIAAALNTLSKKERAALVLRDLEGLPTEEVARILGSSQTTVRSQISAARAKIKKYRDRVLARARRG